MNLTEADDQLIDDVLNERLDELQMEEARQYITSHPPLLDELRTRLELIHGIAAQQDQLKDTFNEMLQRSEKRSTPVFFRIAAGLAVLVMVAALAWWISQRNDQPDVLSYYAFYPEPTILRGADADLQLKECFDAYVRQDYALALAGFTGDCSHVKEVDLYIGSCHLALDQLPAARSVFENGSSVHHQWYQSCVYLKMGESEEARAILEQLATGSSVYQKKAVAILEMW